MVKTTLGGLDDQTTNEPKKVIEEEIKDVAGTVHNEISKDFQKNKESADYQYLLNKPNMTEKDKANMEKSIKSLIDEQMDTEENLKKLEAINYGSNYIEIGGVKRARENLKAEPKPKTDSIIKYNNEIYFKFHVLEEQNKLLADKGMKIPSKYDFVKALKALPGDYLENNWYVGGNILGNILDFSMSGYCNTRYKLHDEGKSCYVWSSGVNSSINNTWAFVFGDNKGLLGGNQNAHAFLIRPVIK